MSMIRYGRWCNVFPCKEECGHILPPAAFYDGRIYEPCPKCGGEIGDGVARRKYEIKKIEEKYFFGLLKREKSVKVFLGWEMRNNTL